jgi:photosystem II stability/assembly factor-like uncharacterized protein
MRGSRLFVGTLGNGVFWSDDLGTTWTAANSGLPSEADIIGIARIGTDLFAAMRVWGDKGLFLRAEGGPGWELVDSGLQAIAEICCLAAAGTNLLAGTDRGIFLSADRGQSWVFAGPDRPDPPRVNCIEAMGTLVLAGTNEGIFRSTNRGRSWSPVTPRLPGSIGVYHIASLGTSLFAGTSEGLYASKDHGASWTPIDAGLPKNSVASLAANGTNLLVGIRRDRSFIELGEEEGQIIDFYPPDILYLSTDGGKRWTTVTEGLPDKFSTGYLVAIGSVFFAALQNYYTKGGTYGLGLYVSRDGGASWTSGEPWQQTTVMFNCFLLGETALFAGTAGRGVWRLPLSALKKNCP